jgi:arsenate reductase (thioredoxin)
LVIRIRSHLVVLFLLALNVALVGCQHAPPQKEPVPILMVCEHGSVKSLMAASLFNKAAEQRRLPFHAVARGVSPDAAVPPRIATALSEDGFDVATFVPAKASATEVSRAARVVVIGLEPDALDGKPTGVVETWRDVPAASTDYAAARASLMQHIDALLDELESDGKR